MTRYYVIAWVFLFIVAVTESVRLGDKCQRDSDCTGTNQECLPVGKPCNESEKSCQCKQCYGPDAVRRNCHPVEFKEPCPVFDPTCDARCSYSKRGYELYPANATCKYGSVRCEPPSCFEVQNRRCVPRTDKKSHQASCQADCECESNLGCVASCECPVGKKWDPKTLTCSERKANFGEECSSDHDCKTYGLSSGNLASGYTNMGGRCIDEMCMCAPGYDLTRTGFYNPNDGSFFTKPICVVSSATINLGQGEECSLNPIAQSDYSTAKICDADTACISCRLLKGEFGTGICRKVIPKESNCGPLGEAINTTATNTEKSQGKVGSSCQRSSQCGYNEICSRPSVDPPCSNGKCACQECFERDEYLKCAPKVVLNLTDRCKHGDNEMYPKNMDCSVRDIVDCKNDRYKVTGPNECSLADYDFVSKDTVCNHLYSNCFPTLLCHSSKKKCQCKHSNEYYDSTQKKCIKRQLGDTCKHDHDCDDRSMTQTVSSGHICKNGVCACDPEFVARSKNSIRNALEIIPPKCGDDQGNSQSKVCAYCPGSIFSKDCAFYNISVLPIPNTAESRNQREICFPNADRTGSTTPAAPSPTDWWETTRKSTTTERSTDWWETTRASSKSTTTERSTDWWETTRASSKSTTTERSTNWWETTRASSKSTTTERSTDWWETTRASSKSTTTERSTNWWETTSSTGQQSTTTRSFWEILFDLTSTTTPAPRSNNEESKVGENCFISSDCGKNEMCFSAYDPICSGTCICKSGYDMNTGNQCVRKPRRQLNYYCTVYTRPDMFSHKNMYCDFGKTECGLCPSKDCAETTIQLSGGNETCEENCDCEGDLICQRYSKKCVCPLAYQKFDSNRQKCVSYNDPYHEHNGQPCRSFLGCFKPDLVCHSFKGASQCKCSETGFIYNYTAGKCYPRDYDDRCETDIQCGGTGKLIENHGYSSVAGAACIDGKCGCKQGYSTVKVANANIKSLWQLPPERKTICLQSNTVDSSKFVQKGGPCSIDPLATVGEPAICSPGLFCVKCPEESSGKCRSLRDKVYD